MLVSPWKVAANPATGVRSYGLGRHLWTLTPEQAVGFEKVGTFFNNLVRHAQCILNLNPRL